MWKVCFNVSLLRMVKGWCQIWRLGTSRRASFVNGPWCRPNDRDKWPTLTVDVDWCFVNFFLLFSWPSLVHDADDVSPTYIHQCTVFLYVQNITIRRFFFQVWQYSSAARQSTHDVSAEHWTLTLQTLDTGPCEPQPGWAGDRALELDPAQPSSRATSRASQPSSWNEELNS